MKLMPVTTMLFGAIISLSGCQHTPGGTVVSDITPEVRNAIAYCNGGIDSETGLKIEATVVENGGKINAALNDKLQGLFLSKPGLTSADAITAQKQYMDCLDKRASKDKTSSIDACQSKLTCEIDTLQMACNCRTSISGIAAEKRLSEASKNKLLADNCYSGQYDLRKCWGGADANSGRAACTVSLQREGRELPAAKEGTCLAKNG